MERRTRKATVRLTEEELARLKEAARRAGWSQEAYPRALKGIEPRPKRAKLPGDDRDCTPSGTTSTRSRARPRPRHRGRRPLR
ncbi:MAG: plasmid mobilization protein [Eggerthellaceae bacterium]